MADSGRRQKSKPGAKPSGADSTGREAGAPVLRIEVICALAQPAESSAGQDVAEAGKAGGDPGHAEELTRRVVYVDLDTDEDTPVQAGGELPVAEPVREAARRPVELGEDRKEPAPPPVPRESGPSAPERALAAHEAEVVAAEARASAKERDLAERETALANAESLAASDKVQRNQRERRVARIEETLRERTQELNEWEARLDGRQAELEAAFGLREDRTERREAEVAERERRLEQREREMSTYVSQLQAELTRRDRASLERRAATR